MRVFEGLRLRNVSPVIPHLRILWVRDMFFELSQEIQSPPSGLKTELRGVRFFMSMPAIVKAFCYAGFLGGRDVAEEYFDAGGGLC